MLTVWVWFRWRFHSSYLSSYKLRKIEKQTLANHYSANELYPLLALVHFTNLKKEI